MSSRTVNTRVAPAVPKEFDSARSTTAKEPPNDQHASVQMKSVPRRLTRASFNEAIVLSKKAVFRGTVIIEAFNAMRMVIRNAISSCICAWIANFFINLGNPFVLASSNNQSTASLIVTNLLWANVIYCAIILLTHTAVLMPLRFLSSPDTPPTLWFCMKKLARASYVNFFSSFAMQLCLGSLVGRVLPSSTHKFKIDFYIGTLVNHHFMTGIGIATRSIFKTKTVQGQERMQRQAQQQQRLQQPRRPCKSTRARLYWIAYTTGSSKLIPMFLAGGAYVHIVSQTHLFHHGLRTYSFVAISTVTKVLIQGAIKIFIIKYRIKDVRTMCALVGLPTVLIDTQVRIMLLCQQSYTFAVTGMVAMTLVEIIIRGFKAALLSIELKHRQFTIHSRASSIMGALVPDPSGTAAPMTSPGNHRAANTPVQSPEQRDFELVRQLMYRFHAAEASADMHAGYIAIGCSASIWFFYSNNRHYDLGQGTAGTGDLSAIAPLLFIQVSLEIVADFVSCILEAAAGVDFKSMNKFGLFLALNFANHGIMNIAISAILYLI